MLARFFYGYGEEIHFKDRLKNGEYPIEDSDMMRIESFLKQIGANIGYYQIDGTDLTSIVCLSKEEIKHNGKYQEICPHCGGYTDYDTADGSIICMWCGEDLLPCVMCSEAFHEKGECGFEDTPHKCKHYIGKNRVPDFSTKYDDLDEKIRVCARCGTPVKKSEVAGYSYYCPGHDEDLYEIETIII